MAKATKQYFPLVLFNMLYKVALTSEFVDETQNASCSVSWCSPFPDTLQNEIWNSFPRFDLNKWSFYLLADLLLKLPPYLVSFQNGIFNHLHTVSHVGDGLKFTLLLLRTKQPRTV